MLVVGLTGSIAMGKSETANMFRRLGHPVFDADTAVHRLYRPGGKAVEPLKARFPSAIIDGAVDREALSKLVLADPEVLRTVEAIVHPLVREAEIEFLDGQRRAGKRLAVLDIPLLYESGRHAHMDAVVVVSAPEEVQRGRALERPGMTPEKLDAILARQVPDEHKRQRADYVVMTDRGLEETFESVRAVADDLLTRDRARG